MKNIIKQLDKRIMCLEYEKIKLKDKADEFMSLYHTERQIKNDYKIRVLKAIDYINTFSNNCMFELRSEELEELLQILKKEV